MTRSILQFLFTFTLFSCGQDVKEVGPYFTFLHHHDEFELIEGNVDTLRDPGSQLQAQVATATEELLLHIENMMQSLLDSAGQQDPRIEPASRAPNLDKLLDNRISSSFLIGNEPVKPVTTPYSASALRQRLEDHKRLLHELTGIDIAFFDAMLNTEDLKASHNRTLENWETAKFWKMSLLHALDELTLIKTHLLKLELSLITAA